MTPALRQITLSEYSGEIRAFNATRPDMLGIAGYNREMVGILDRLFPLQGKRLLDLGASPHGYALERALEIGAAEYVGINLNIAKPLEVQHKNGAGKLLRMDAEALEFAPDSFDAVLTISTFEHFFDGPQVLREVHRVLRPEGRALASFEPIWSSSIGHHLHHIEAIGRLLPPWSHLLLDESGMRRFLATRWNPRLPMSVDEIAYWIYHGNEINRVDICRHEEILRGSPLQVEWIAPLRDEDKGDLLPVARYLSALLPYSTDQLMTRGFSALFSKR